MGLSFITGLETQDITTEDFIKFADKALYLSKMEGKNRISVWDKEKIMFFLEK